MFHEKTLRMLFEGFLLLLQITSGINSRIDMHEFWSLDWLFKWFGCTRFSKNS